MQCSPHWRNRIMRIRLTDLCSTIRCEDCGRYLGSDCYYKSYLRSNRLRCRVCVIAAKQCSTERDMCERILNTLRRSERELQLRSQRQQQQLGLSPGEAERREPSGFSLRLIQYLVEQVWGCCSAVRGDTAGSLVLVRWDMEQPFSIQNHCLLTTRQAKQHYAHQLRTPMARQLLYGSRFCAQIEAKLASLSLPW